MKTAAEVRQEHAKVISDAVDVELARINTIIEKHIENRNRENTIAVELDSKTAPQVRARLTSIGYKVRESEYDPREPHTIDYTYITW
jgi:hypothetical protein